MQCNIFSKGTYDKVKGTATKYRPAKTVLVAAPFNLLKCHAFGDTLFAVQFLFEETTKDIEGRIYEYTGL